MKNELDELKRQLEAMPKPQPEMSEEETLKEQTKCPQSPKRPMSDDQTKVANAAAKEIWAYCESRKFGNGDSMLEESVIAAIISKRTTIRLGRYATVLALAGCGAADDDGVMKWAARMRTLKRAASEMVAVTHFSGCIDGSTADARNNLERALEREKQNRD